MKGFSSVVYKRNIVFRIAAIVFFSLTFMISTAQVAIDTAVDFTVKDVESDSHNLFNYLDGNKIVVIDFFTTTCGPCQTYASHVSQAYEYFGCNEGNVIFLGINWGSDNEAVRLFDTLWNARYPSISGTQGGGNSVIDDFQVLSYPTVIVITPDHLIPVKYIWPPMYDSIVPKVIAAGGIPQPCTVSVSYNEIIHPYITALAEGKLLIDLSTVKESNNKLSIYSMDGRLQWETVMGGSVVSTVGIPVRKGLYIACLQSNNMILATTKIIIQ